MSAGGEADEATPRVGGVRRALDVALRLESGDGLGGGLLTDPEPSPELGRGDAVGADGLQREAVCGAGVGVPLVCQLGVQLVDKGLKPQEQQQRQGEPGPRVS